MSASSSSSRNMVVPRDGLAVASGSGMSNVGEQLKNYLKRKELENCLENMDQLLQRVFDEVKSMDDAKWSKEEIAKKQSVCQSTERLQEVAGDIMKLFGEKFGVCKFLVVDKLLKTFWRKVVKAEKFVETQTRISKTQRETIFEGMKEGFDVLMEKLENLKEDQEDEAEKLIANVEYMEECRKLWIFLKAMDIESTEKLAVWMEAKSAENLKLLEEKKQNERKFLSFLEEVENEKAVNREASDANARLMYEIQQKVVEVQELEEKLKLMEQNLDLARNEISSAEKVTVAKNFCELKENEREVIEMLNSVNVRNGDQLADILMKLTNDSNAKEILELENEKISLQLVEMDKDRHDIRLKLEDVQKEMEQWKENCERLKGLINDSSKSEKLMGHVRQKLISLANGPGTPIPKPRSTILTKVEPTRVPEIAESVIKAENWARKHFVEDGNFVQNSENFDNINENVKKNEDIVQETGVSDRSKLSDELYLVRKQMSFMETTFRANALPDPKAYTGDDDRNFGSFLTTFKSKYGKLMEKDEELMTILEERFLVGKALQVFRTIPKKDSFDETMLEFQERLKKSRSSISFSSMRKLDQLHILEHQSIRDYCLLIEKLSREAFDMDDEKIAPLKVTKLLKAAQRDQTLHCILNMKRVEVDLKDQYETLKRIALEFEEENLMNGNQMGYSDNFERSRQWDVNRLSHPGGRKLDVNGSSHPGGRNLDVNGYSHPGGRKWDVNGSSHPGGMKSSPVSGSNAVPVGSNDVLNGNVPVENKFGKNCFKCGKPGHYAARCQENNKVAYAHGVICDEKALRQGNHAVAGSLVLEQAKILGKEVTIIIDSGSEVSLLSTKTWSRVKKGNLTDEKFVESPSDKDLDVIDASNTKMNIVHRVVVPIEIRHKKKSVSFQVCESNEEYAVLGTNSFESFGIRIGWKDVDEDKKKAVVNAVRLKHFGEAGSVRKLPFGKNRVKLEKKCPLKEDVMYSKGIVSGGSVKDRNFGKAGDRGSEQKIGGRENDKMRCKSKPRHRWSKNVTNVTKPFVIQGPSTVKQLYASAKPNRQMFSIAKSQDQFGRCSEVETSVNEKHQEKDVEIGVKPQNMKAKSVERKGQSGKRDKNKLKIVKEQYMDRMDSTTATTTELLSPVKMEIDEMNSSPSSYMLTPNASMHKRSHPNIPTRKASVMAMKSQLRTPRGHPLSNASAGELPYTPPPILAPMRNGSGLFCSIAKSFSQQTSEIADVPSCSTDSDENRMLNGKKTSEDSDGPSRKNGFFYMAQQMSQPNFANELAELRKASGASTSSSDDKAQLERKQSINNQEAIRKLSCMSDCYYDYVPEGPQVIDPNPHINIGKEYQARVRKWNERTVHSCELEAIEDRDELMFSSDVLTDLDEEQISAFELLACSQACPRIGNHRELAIHLLMENKGNIEAAVEDLLRCDTLDWEQYSNIFGYLYNDSAVWTADEVNQFQDAIYKSEKDFDKVAQELPGKTVRECVQFYYTWKKTCPDDYRKLRNLRRKRQLLEMNLKQQMEDPPIPMKKCSLQESVDSDADSNATDVSFIGNMSAEFRDRSFTSPMLSASPTVSPHVAPSPTNKDLFGLQKNYQPTIPRSHTQSASANKKGAQPSADGFFHCRLCEKCFEKVKSLNAHMKSHAMKARAEQEAKAHDAQLAAAVQLTNAVTNPVQTPQLNPFSNGHLGITIPSSIGNLTPQQLTPQQINSQINQHLQSQLCNLSSQINSMASPLTPQQQLQLTQQQLVARAMQHNLFQSQQVVNVPAQNPLNGIVQPHAQHPLLQAGLHTIN